MYPGLTLDNDQLNEQIFNTFITILYMYMFRAISCSSSGRQIVLTRHLAHLSITFMYINSQNTAVRSNISYYSFRYFIVVSFRRHVSAHSFEPSSGLQIY